MNPRWLDRANGNYIGPLARLIQQFDPGGQALVTSLFRAGVSERGRRNRLAKLPEGKRALVRGFMESSLKGEGAEVRRVFIGLQMSSRRRETAGMTGIRDRSTDIPQDGMA